MPSYRHRCWDCGDSFEEFRSIHADAPSVCTKCGGDLRQLLDKPRIMGDISPYRSIVTGELITSRSKHRQHLKDNDLVEVGDQEPDWMREERRREAEQQE